MLQLIIFQEQRLKSDWIRLDSTSLYCLVECSGHIYVGSLHIPVYLLWSGVMYSLKLNFLDNHRGHIRVCENFDELQIQSSTCTEKIKWDFSSSLHLRHNAVSERSILYVCLNYNDRLVSLLFTCYQVCK